VSVLAVHPKGTLRVRLFLQIRMNHRHHACMSAISAYYVQVRVGGLRPPPTIAHARYGDVMRARIRCPQIAGRRGCGRRDGCQGRLLSNPVSYPDKPPRVETPETRFARVFLAGERAYALRLADAVAKREGEQLRIFLIGEALSCAKAGQTLPQGYYNIAVILHGAARHGVEIGICSTCMNARGISEQELTGTAVGVDAVG
jgi:hypothetical protein